MFPFLHVFICVSVFKKYNKTPKYDNEIKNELLVKQGKEGVKRNSVSKGLRNLDGRCE